jgi:ABC-type multidrug transport system fused ATPase/permease subunit
MKKYFLIILNQIGVIKLFIFTTLNILVLILELLTFSAFIPLLLALTNKDRLLDNEFFIKILNFFKIDTNNFSELLFFLFLNLAFIFFIKNLIILISKYIQFKIAADIEISLTSQVFRKYLYKPYIYLTSKNSSKIIRDVIAEAGMFTRALLTSLINLVIEVIVFFGIFIIIYLNQPVISQKLVISFSIIGLIFYYLFKKKFNYLGRERQLEDRERIKIIQQGIQGIKEITSFNLQNFLIELFDKSNNKVLKSIHFANFINQVPKLIFEFTAVLIIIFVFYTTNEINNSADEQLFILGLIAVAAFRLFPAINRILLALNTLEYSKASIRVLTEIFVENDNSTEKISPNKNTVMNYDNLHKNEAQVSDDLSQSSKIEFSYNIELKNIKFKYPTSDDFIFKNLDLTVSKGDQIGIMGITGSGKSTLVDLILGILKPLNGEILCDGKDIFYNLEKWRKTIGYVPQFPYMLDTSVIENIAVGIKRKDISEERVANCLKIANLEQFVYSLKDGLNTSVGERGVKFSGGQIQRLAIARALYREPEILMLDEATSSVDSKTQSQIINDLNKLKNKITFISISHDKKALIHCDKVYQLQNQNLQNIK